MIGNDNMRYIIYDASIYSALVEDEGWLKDTAANLGMTVDGLKRNGLDWREASEQRFSDLDLETFYIDRRFDERVAELHPEWDESGNSPYLLMVRGMQKRCDGVRSGYNYYPRGDDGNGAFAALLSDNDRGGLFQDCEIDLIWEDRNGTLHVRGTHHDEITEVACRAVPPGTARGDEEQGDIAWEQGVDAEMVEFYGFAWPCQEKLSALEMECALSCGPVEVAEPISEKKR